jgi:hypothetical protein
MLRFTLQFTSHAMSRSALGMTVLATGLLTGELGGRTDRLPADRADHASLAPFTALFPDASRSDSTTTRFPTRLDGAFWSRLTPAEKQIYLQGFVAGAAAEQVGAAGGEPADALRDRHALHYAFQPPVYAAQMDDFYWWQNHVTTPIVEAMRQINSDKSMGPDK